MRGYLKTLAMLWAALFSSFSFSSGKYIGLTQDQVAALGGKPLSSGMWGENLAVDTRFREGKTNIFLIEFYGEFQQQSNAIKRRSTRTVDFLAVSLTADERISDGSSFRCLDGETSVIGVFKKRVAQEKGRFPAIRAWKIDQTSKKILPVTDLRSVTCDWYRNGEEEFPKNL